MARSARPSGKTFHKPSRPSQTSAKKNASGYAKRQASKKQKPSPDVYEYTPEKVRRSKVTLDLAPDEEGFDLDDPNVDRAELRARLVGENDEEEMINSSDDEEIDSDAAFEESDNEQYAGFFSMKKKQMKRMAKQPTVRFAEVDLNEDESMDGGSAEDGEDGTDGAEDEDEEDESGEDGEFIDVLDILDGKGEPDDESDVEKKSSRPSPMEQDDEGDSSGEDEDQEDEDVSEAEEDAPNPFSISDDETEGAPEALNDLNDFIAKLDTSAKKRKSPEPPADDRPRKRRVIFEQTEIGPENEFRARPNGDKLDLDDLLAPLASKSSDFSSLKQSTKALASTKVQTLSAPLPQRAQERLDREAAYEQTKGEVDKWSATMKRIREAEHLSFPLQAETEGRISNLELAAKFKPTTKLESSVDALLKSAELREQDIQHTEDNLLRMNKLSVEELAERRAELRKMRELMFRAEIKAKRVAKIKSKTYRKIHRKEKERLKEKLGDKTDSDAEEVQLKREIDRARERATLKHKNTGKWAKQQKMKHGFDEGGRAEIEEMLDRGEKLRRRIAGRASDDSDDDSEEDDSDADPEDIKQRAFDELAKANLDDPEEPGSKKSKIFEMKFMKDAMARQQQETDRQAEDMLKELAGVEGEGDDEEDNAHESGVVVSRVGGRAVYRPGVPQKNSPSKGPKASDDLTGIASEPGVISASHASASASHPDENDTNPWLADETSLRVARKKNEVVVSRDSKDAEKSKNKLKKQAKKNAGNKQQEADDAAVEISVDNVLGAKPAQTTQAGGDPDSDSSENEELAAQENTLQQRKGKGKDRGVKAFEQRELVAMAFAGDNVVKQFEEAKQREINADAPHEVDTTIPGWGSWGGAGVSKRASKPKYVKEVAGIDPKSRADYNKSHVIISEKKDKKAAKYMVKDLPYPYTSKAQYDRRMEQPLGAEWNTRVGFQRGTLPKVVKKMGTVINPLEKLF